MKRIELTANIPFFCGLSVTFKAISLFNFHEISCDQTIRHDERAARCGEEIN